MAKERLFLGLYSGPAADGVDAALAAVRGSGPAMSVQQIAHTQKLYPEEIRRRIRVAPGRQGEGGAKELAELGRDIAVAAARTGLGLLEEANIPAENIQAVGWSGQTIFLLAPGATNELGAAMELGAPAVVARRVGRPVAAGFVASDLAAGGAGGPVTSWCDWLLFRDERLTRVTVHLGGIAAACFLPAGAEASDVEAFDVGPGTIVIDELMQKDHHRLWDADGATASAGRVCAPLLNELLAHPYFQVDPPKQTHAADWTNHYIFRLLHMAQKHGCRGADLIATVTELTAQAVARAVGFAASGPITERAHEVILTGGGALNIYLAGRIRALLSPSSTYTVEHYGLALRAKQALCHAVLAAARLDEYPAHCHHATGAERSSVLGAILK
ncbi:MAG: anhydro-N-acetylmuramic acid kinase [Phycisphaerae bacterium]|nr:anhydro-N-acetylmuramic acid kinase [Phycisphaerae bacterium]